MVPAKYDVVIDGYGYVLDRSQDTKAVLEYTPTFVERQNVSNQYGDDAQAFFLTASQKDWSGGEGQRHFNADDANSTSRYFEGSAIDIGKDGQVTLEAAVSLATTGTVVYSATALGSQIDPTGHGIVGTSNLFTLSAAGVLTDRGAHGAGTPSRWGSCSDGVKLYIAGASKIRKMNSSFAFSDFSATGAAGSLAFMNNTLYSLGGGVLRSYDTAGTATTLFTWNDATGTATAAGSQAFAKIIPFGSKLLIWWPLLVDRPELWEYDGSGTARVADFPSSAIGYDIAVINGVVFVSGLISDQTLVGDSTTCPVVWFYSGGEIGEVWRGEAEGTTITLAGSTLYPGLGSHSGNLMIACENQLFEYSLTAAALSLKAAMTPSATSSAVISSSSSSVAVHWFDNTVSSVLYPGASSTAITGYVKSSLFDFGNSLTKILRGVKVDWKNASVGAGSTSVDIAYRLNSLDSSTFTALQTAAVTGTEYLFPDNTTAQSVSVKVTLNCPAASSSRTPIIHRVYVRAVPQLQSFRKATYVIDCSGVDGNRRVRLQDGTDHALDGLAMLTNLKTTLTAATAVSVTDALGTFTGVIEAGGLRAVQVRPSEFVVTVPVREV